MELSTFPAQRAGSGLLVLEIKPPAQARPLPGPGWARGFSPIPLGKLCRCHLAKFGAFGMGLATCGIFQNWIYSPISICVELRGQLSQDAV